MNTTNNIKWLAAKPVTEMWCGKLSCFLPLAYSRYCCNDKFSFPCNFLANYEHSNGGRANPFIYDKLRKKCEWFKHVYVCVRNLATNFNLIEWNRLNKVKLFVRALKTGKEQINLWWPLLKRREKRMRKRTILLFPTLQYAVMHEQTYTVHLQVAKYPNGMHLKYSFSHVSDKLKMCSAQCSSLNFDQNY